MTETRRPGPAPARYQVTRSRSPTEIAAAQALRSRCFGIAGRDSDPLDASCEHFLVRDRRDGRLVCCYRVLLLTSSRVATDSYSARYYDLTRLVDYPGAIAELGRFCIDPAVTDPDVLRIAWAALAGYVEDNGVRLLIGCSSFAGTDAGPYLDSFARLRARHLAPERWRPGPKAPETIGFAAADRTGCAVSTGLERMPSLLRSYIAMGGWVSDHAVVDRQMNTLHVFTGLEVDQIPPFRKRALRSILEAIGPVQGAGQVDDADAAR